MAAVAVDDPSALAPMENASAQNSGAETRRLQLELSFVGSPQNRTCAWTNVRPQMGLIGSRGLGNHYGPGTGVPEKKTRSAASHAATRLVPPPW